MAYGLESLHAALAGRYQIERELGAGGMATVYLALDLKHHRHVAIKVLRPELAATLGADRFLLEIETTAQLTHPHILPLLDSGGTDGVLFYAMPYIEGESLRDRLTREKQLPLDDALQLTREVAEALAYAHSRGVIHRDIKPENILLEAGHAVVADFGIARALGAAGGPRLTGTGMSLGTPAYMSPEQAGGESELDGRSDLYSLGCVLYEMLGGEPPYTGLTPAMVMAKKLSEPLPRISVIRETVPPGVEAVLGKALARTPADRFATCTQFAEALARRELVATTSGGTVLRRVPRWGKWTAALAGVVVIAAVGVTANRLLLRRPLNITVSDITPVTSQPGREFQPSISPDGREVAYVAGPLWTPRLFIRSTVDVSSGAALSLADTALQSDWLPVWSPDGQYVRFRGCPGRWGASFWSPSCTWRETGRLGGASRPIAGPAQARSARNLAWSPDGGRVVFAVQDTLFVATTADTLPRRVAIHTVKYDYLHSFAWSPDGTRIAYVNGNPGWQISGGAVGSSIWIVDAGRGNPHQVIDDENLNVSPAWLDARHLLFVSNRDGPRGVYVVEVGSEGPHGTPRLVPGIAEPHSISYSIGARMLVFAKSTVHQNIWAYPLASSAAVPIRNGRQVTFGNQVAEDADASPDGKWIVYSTNVRGNADLFKVPLGGGDAVPLAASAVNELNPRWSPDGREIAFTATASHSPATPRVMVMPADGGRASIVAEGPGLAAFPAWSPSGLAIAYVTSDGSNSLVWERSRDSAGGAWHEPVQLTSYSCHFPAWAPDGRGVWCSTGRDLVLISPRGDVLERLHPAFFSYYWALSRDGRTVYFPSSSPDGQPGIWAMPVPGGTPRRIVAFGDPTLAIPGRISVDRDHVYTPVWEHESDIWVARLNW